MAKAKKKAKKKASKKKWALTRRSRKWPPSRIRGLCPLLTRAQSFREDAMAAEGDAKKRRAALAALELVANDAIIGVGTGSTVNFFIEALAAHPGRVRCAVSSSEASSTRLRAAGISIADLNELAGLDLYVDGADEATEARHLIKGGGAALT